MRRESDSVRIQRSNSVVPEVGEAVLRLRSTSVQSSPVDWEMEALVRFDRVGLEDDFGPAASTVRTIPE